MTPFTQLFANGLVNGTLFALLATGFGLVYRSTGVFHIAYGGSFVLAAFVFHSLVTLGGLSWSLAGIGTIAISALAGWAMETAFYGPFFRRRTASGAVMVASLGLATVIENTLALIYGNELRAIPRELALVITFGPVRLTEIQLAQLGVGFFVLIVLAWVRRLPLFRLVRAMGENPELLLVHGGRLNRLRSFVFALSGALAAVPACLIMIDVGMDVHSGLSAMLIAAVGVLAGGISRVEGWVLGAFLLAILQILVVWQFSTKWLDLVAFLLLLIVLLFRREGLLSNPTRVEES